MIALPAPPARPNAARVALCVSIRAALAAALALGSFTALAQPARLSETGLFTPGSTTQTAPGVIAFEPRYALWSDGAEKRRWLRLPAGSAIDATRPDAWQFPPGTKLWKEFAQGGLPVETRLIERRADGQWRFASYIWAADGRDALLAPERGAVLAVAAAPGGTYEVPSRHDCLGCHESNPVPVIGLSAVQLAALPEWLRAGRVRGLKAPFGAAWQHEAPRLAAASDDERAALGYLHANCGHCHNRGEQRAPLPLTLHLRAADPEASRSEVLHSLVDAPSRLRGAGPNVAQARGANRLVVRGAPEQSLLLQRLSTRESRLQMPPLGTRHPDGEGLALVERWITGAAHP